MANPIHRTNIVAKDKRSQRKVADSTTELDKTLLTCAPSGSVSTAGQRRYNPTPAKPQREGKPTRPLHRRATMPTGASAPKGGDPAEAPSSRSGSGSSEGAAPSVCWTASERCCTSTRSR